MTSTEQRTAPAVPAPRTGSPDDRPAARTTDPEPWRTTPRARPRTEYWDVTGARWVSAPRG
ncbi:hypothetical protein [Blastococcus sp. SYSU D01042]